LELSALDGSNGFKISGAANGRSASAAGDVNGDGFDDLIIGSPQTPATYVIFGKESGFAADLNVSTLNGSNGFKITPVSFGDFIGNSVSAAGDVNGDGFGDVIIGAYYSYTNGAEKSGASYVIFGKASGFSAELNVSTLNGANGFKLSGVASRDFSGSSVSGAGDVNRDGFDDVIIGAGRDGYTSGSGVASYVVFGKASGFAANLNLSALNGSNGFKLSGVAGDVFLGRSVSTAGDVNGDGFADVIIGGFSVSSSGRSGATHVVFGKATAFGANLNLSTLDGRTGFKLTGVAGDTYSGRSVSTAGDVNGDGFADLIIGADGADPNGYQSGASYVFFGKRTGFAASLNLSALDGSNGSTLNGVAAGDASGHSVSTAGDVNGDGFGDLIIGAYQADPHGTSSGASYVVFGRGVEVNVSDAVASEGNAGTAALQFTVSLTEAGSVPIGVKVATANGSALVNSDYAPLASTTLTFAPAS
jgi:hypothetical protein